jgi:ArsR family transcriptional regulator, arsenate/arsenite/antimonite-responsive transcriptional repressor
MARTATPLAGTHPHARPATLPATLVALGDPVRWRIVQLLAREELCVCHLVEELDLAQPLVSHHLKVLRTAGIVAGDRFRYWTYYRLVPGALAAVEAELQALSRTSPASARRPCC